MLRASGGTEPERVLSAMPPAMHRACVMRCHEHLLEHAACGCPDPTQPAHPLSGKFLGTATSTPSSLSVPRSRLRARGRPCWACDELVDGRHCSECGAPEWSGYVVSGGCNRPGVYVVESAVGLFKIGMSHRNVSRRVGELVGMACRGAVLGAVASLPGAGYPVESWLHRAFADTRDRSWAHAEVLPCSTEWFWPTPALRALIAGEAFVDGLTPEFDPLAAS